MSWLAPAAFVWLALVGIMVAIYLLRPKRRRVVVPSLLLWIQEDPDSTGSTFWRWLRRHLLLILQVLALVALILSLARPEWLLDRRIRPDLVLVLDGSGRFGAPTSTVAPFERIKGAALEYTRDAGRGASISIVLATGLPELVAIREDGRTAVTKVIDRLGPGSGPADMTAALDVAQSILREGPGGSIAIFSDGRFEVDDPLLLARAGLIEIGSGLGRLSIETVVARPDRSGSIQVLVGVSSSSPEDREVEVAIRVGEAETRSRTLSVPSNARAVAIFDDVQGTGDIEAVLRGPGSSGGSTGAAFSRLPSRSEIRAAVISGEPSAYVRALDVLPNIIVQGIDPASYNPEARFDLYVFDRFVPEILPRASMIFFSPPAGNPYFDVDTEVTGSIPVEAHDAKILRFVDLTFLEPGESTAITVPDWSQPDLTLDGEAALFHGNFDGRLTIVASFDPVDAGMVDTAAFPIFIHNAVEWANPLRAVPGQLRSFKGDALALQPHPQATDIEITDPAGTKVETIKVVDSLSVGPFSVPGVYSLRQMANGRLLGEEDFTIHSPHFGDEPSPSKIELPPPPPLPSGTGEIQTEPAGLWTWFVLGALVVLGGEWVWFHRVRAAT